MTVQHTHRWQIDRYIRRFCYALLIALLWLICMPGFASAQSAHALLDHSDPARDAVLTNPPSQVRMWFTESLNPSFSTAYVINAAQSNVKDVIDPHNHLDNADVHVSPDNAQEMDLSLKLLPPGVYAVIYRTQSADDGHIASGNFIFKIAQPNGVVPEYNGQLPPLPSFGTVTSNGQLDGTTLFNLFMTTLLELCIVFWVGAQLWQTFLTPENGEKKSPELVEDGVVAQQDGELQQRAAHVFHRQLALPILCVLFVANMGVLFGQAVTLTNGRWDLALSPHILQGLLSSGSFSRYWLIRSAVLVVALLLAVLGRRMARQNKSLPAFITWGNFLLALALITTTVLSGHAAAVRSTSLLYAVLVDWAHLLAASLWIGGMLYLALACLPAVHRWSKPLLERVPALLSTLKHFSPMAFTGVVLMAVTGPLNATTRMESWEQLLSTAYGRTLLVKSTLVGGMLLVSALHVFFWRPRLAYDYQLYNEWNGEEGEKSEKTATGEEFKRFEQNVARQFRRITRVLSWEPLLGVAVLLCTGLLTVFSGTLLPATPVSPASASQPSQPFHNIIKTKDNIFTLDVTLTPNRFGSNQLIVKVKDSQGNVPNDIGVSAYSTMLDMDMGSTPLQFQAAEAGTYRTTCDFGMGGHWELRINVLSANQLHSATFTVDVSL